MGVKVNVQRNDLEYESGCIVKHKKNGWYGILYRTNVANNTYNVLKFDEEGKGRAYLYYTSSNLNLLNIQNTFQIVTNEEGYDLTLTLKGDN